MKTLSNTLIFNHQNRLNAIENNFLEELLNEVNNKHMHNTIFILFISNSAFAAENSVVNPKPDEKTGVVAQAAQSNNAIVIPGLTGGIGAVVAASSAILGFAALMFLSDCSSSQSHGHGHGNYISIYEYIL
jgi:hypothetical protein